MGLTVWKGEIIRKTDVTVAKNYLSADEIDELNRIVVRWLDYAEDQARRRTPATVTGSSFRREGAGTGSPPCCGALSFGAEKRRGSPST